MAVSAAARFGDSQTSRRSVASHCAQHSARDGIDQVEPPARAQDALGLEPLRGEDRELILGRAVGAELNRKRAATEVRGIDVGGHARGGDRGRGGLLRISERCAGAGPGTV